MNKFPSVNKKIKSLEELIYIRKKLKKEKKSVVTTNGSYDIFHVGHVWSLQESKQQGDVLIVGINSDASIKEYKSTKRPIIPQDYRIEVVAALECVDFVFIFNEITPNIFLEKLCPDIHTNSSDYGENCIEAKTIKKIGAQLYLLKKYKEFSTSEIIKKIKHL